MNMKSAIIISVESGENQAANNSLARSSRRLLSGIALSLALFAAFAPRATPTWLACAAPLALDNSGAVAAHHRGACACVSGNKRMARRRGACKTYRGRHRGAAWRRAAARARE
jgi:hypothetical protein